MKQDQKMAEICKVLGVDTRIKIIRLLGEKCFCVGDLSQKLGITQGAVSQHLRMLRSVGLVMSEKRGYFVHYCLNEDVLQNWQDDVGTLLELKAASK